MDKDGGAAFPYEIGTQRGMTLRDWFAGQCMRDTFAALAAAGWENLNDYQLKRCAEASYLAADAMLTARHSREGT